MTQTQHTPGPWTTRGCIVKAAKFTVGTAYIQPPTTAEAVANARLIAAAPMLLEALEEISKGAGAYSMDPLEHASNCVEDMKELATAAIKAATEG